MNFHKHGLSFQKDGPGQATLPAVRWLHCCHILQLTSRCDWTAWEARDGWQIRGIRVSKLSSEQRNRHPPPQARGDGEGDIVRYLEQHVSLCPRRSPLAFIYSSLTETGGYPVRFFVTAGVTVSGEVVDSVSNQHDLIGHYCFRFPPFTKALHFSLSLHLILFIVHKV